MSNSVIDLKNVLYVDRLYKQVPVLESSSSLGTTVLWNVSSPLFDARSFGL